MSIAKASRLISVDEYLAGELVSPVKHEYLRGMVYAMAGASNAHNMIAVNIISCLHAKLRGSPCRPFNSDTKIRVRLPHQVRFYYPDVSVICRPNSQDESFQDEPKIVFEVMSRATRRLDEWEKRDPYLTISSLGAYILVDTEQSAVFVDRRTDQGFVCEVFAELNAAIPLPEIDAELPLAEIYDGVELVPEPDED